VTIERARHARESEKEQTFCMRDRATHRAVRTIVEKRRIRRPPDSPFKDASAFSAPVAKNAYAA
jgi:hypothetical protein